MGGSTPMGIPPAAAPVAAETASHGALRRERLVQLAGWSAAAGEAVLLVVRGRRYLLTPLARIADWQVMLAEWPGQPGLPEYHTRADLHRRSEKRGGRTLTLFTDAAGTREVWCWDQALPLGGSLYRELHGAGDAVAALPRSFLCEAAPPLVPERAQAVRQGAREASHAFLAHLSPSSMHPPPLRQGRRLPMQLPTLIHRSGQPEVVRGIWRALERFRVLDPACGSGDWLLGCLEALAPIGIACLDRMQGWVEDHARAEGHRRPALFRDFRHLLARRRELGRTGRPDRLVYEMLLLRCLYGVEADPAAAARSRTRLAARLMGPAQDPEVGAEEAFVDVRVGSLAAAVPSSSDLARGRGRESPPGGVATDLAARTEPLDRAAERLACMRLRMTGSVDDLREGRETIRLCRELLTASLPRSARAGERIAFLHPWIEFGAVIRQGGFHLIRGRHGEIPPACTHAVPG